MKRNFITRQLSKAVKGIPSAGNVIDATISAISPKWGIKRREARVMSEIIDRQTRKLMNYFDGTDNDRLRGDTWMRSRLSPDSALEMDLEQLRNSADELYRTFSYLHGAVEHRAVNIVGKGMQPQCRVRVKEGIADEKQAEEWKESTEDLFSRWASKAGPGNRQTFWRMQRNFARTRFRLGEAIWVMSDVGLVDKPIPLQISQIAPERLETPPEFEGDPEVRLGIRKQDDVPVTYYFRKAHPNDTKDVTIEYDAVEAWRVLHWYEELFEGQSRGLPWCFANINDIRDIKDFREATIISAQVAACVSLIVTTKGGAAAAMAGATDQNQTMPLEPGQILFRNDITDVHQLNPTQPATTYGMFTEWGLLGIGAGLNYPHGWLVRDRRRASYSAGRLEEIEGSAVINCDQQDMRDIALAPIWERVIDEGIITGDLDIDPVLFNENRSHFLRHKFPSPGRPWIDPPKESKSAIAAIKENITTLADVTEKIGAGDYEEILHQRAREKKLSSELGLKETSQQKAVTA